MATGLTLKTLRLLEGCRAAPGEWRAWTSLTTTTAYVKKLLAGVADGASFEVESRTGAGHRVTYLRYAGPVRGPGTGGTPPRPARPERHRDGRVRCPHCLGAFAPRTGEMLDEALARHGADRPLCRPAIEGLPA